MTTSTNIELCIFERLGMSRKMVWVNREFQVKNHCCQSQNFQFIFLLIDLLLLSGFNALIKFTIIYSQKGGKKNCALFHIINEQSQLQWYLGKFLSMWGHVIWAKLNHAKVGAIMVNWDGVACMIYIYFFVTDFANVFYFND